LHVVGFGTPRNIEFHLAEPLIVVSDEGDLDLDGLAPAGIGKVLLHPFAIGLVRSLFPDLGQMVLTSGVVDVRSEFGALAHQRTAATEQVPRGAPISAG